MNRLPAVALACLAVATATVWTFVVTSTDDATPNHAIPATQAEPATTAPTSNPSVPAPPPPPTGVVDSIAPGPTTAVDPSLRPPDTARAVAAAVVATTYRYDTRTDTSPRDAALRARSWLTPAYRRLLSSPVIRTTATWRTWTRSDAVSAVHLTPIPRIGTDTPPAGTLVSFEVTVDLTGDGGWSDTTTSTVTATCLRRSGDWVVNALDVT